MQILLVEDDSNDVVLFRRALRREKLDCELCIVQDGQEAIDWLSGCCHYADRSQFPLPDLVVSDLKMPRVNGFELFQWIRAQPCFRELAFWVLTSSGQQSDRQHAAQLGVTDYFLKSPFFEDIISRLKALTAAVVATRET